MTIFQHKDWRRARVPYPSTAGQVVSKRWTYTVAGNEAANDVIEMAQLPANMRVVDMIYDSDDLDTNAAPTIAHDVGLMSGKWGDDDAGRTCGDEFFDGDTTAQAGGVARPSQAKAFETGGADYDRSIGIKFAAAAATGVAGTIGLTVFVTPDT